MRIKLGKQSVERAKIEMGAIVSLDLIKEQFTIKCRKIKIL